MDIRVEQSKGVAGVEGVTTRDAKFGGGLNICYQGYDGIVRATFTDGPCNLLGLQAEGVNSQLTRVQARNACRACMAECIGKHLI